jgi:hypothetical protein
MSFRYMKALLLKSATIQQQIDKEMVRPKPDSLKLLELKMKRLSIKDKIMHVARMVRRRRKTAFA